MAMLKYYKVDDWMIIIGEGFTVTTGLLALIKSFNDNGSECIASTAYLAEFCGCSRRKIFDELRYLTEKGYITANKGKKTDIVGYTVNVEKCMQDAAEIQNEQSAYAESAQALMQNLHKPYAESAQALMQNLHTENKNGKTESNMRGGTARARAEAPTTSGASASNEQDLTEEQKEHIMHGFVYPTAKNGKKYMASHYLALYPRYSYKTILGFLEEDTFDLSKEAKKDKIEHAKQIKESAMQGKVQLSNGEWVDGFKDESGIIHKSDGTMCDSQGDEVI